MKLQAFAFLRELSPSSVKFDDKSNDPLIPGDWFQLAKTGTFYSPIYGKITILPQDLATMYRNFKTKTPLPPTQLIIDWDHLSDEPQQPGDGKAAGWVQDLQIRDGGATLWCLPKWTKEAATLIAQGAYRFVSPYFLTDYLDKQSGQRIGPTLKAVAITNRPFLEGMEEIPAPAIAASDTKRPRMYLPKTGPKRRLKDMAKGCRHCGAPQKVVDAIKAAEMDDAGGAVAGEEMEELAGAKGDASAAPAAGSISCPHCGAPVKYQAAPLPDGGDDASGDDTDDAGAEGLDDSDDGAIPDATGHGAEALEDLDDASAGEGMDDAGAEGLDEAGGDADALDELDDQPAPPAPAAAAMAGLKPVKPAVPPPPGAKPAAPMPPKPPVNPAALREQVRQLSEKNSITEKALRRIQIRERRRFAEQLLSRAVRAGKVTPKLVGSVDRPGWARSFAWRDPKGFQLWLRGAPQLVDFSERTTTKAEQPQGNAVALSERVSTLATQKMKADAKLTFSEATKQVFAENRALADQYDRQQSTPVGGREWTASESSNTNVSTKVRH